MSFLNDEHVKGVNISGRRKSRGFLLQALYQWYISKTPIAEIKNQFYANPVFNKSKLDTDYFDQVLTNIPSCISEIDSLIAQYIDRPLKNIDAVEISILRIGCYELLKRDDVPYKVTINECIEIAKIYGGVQSHKYINGILDKLASYIEKTL